MSATLREPDFARRAAALEARAAAPPATTWRPKDPKHPQTIVGVVESRERGPDFGYGPHDLVTLCTPAGERWAVFLMHQVVREEFDRLQPRPGDLVAVRYEGRVAAGQGANGYEKFSRPRRSLRGWRAAGARRR